MRNVVISLARTESTNQVARHMALAGKPAGTIIRAEQQSGGKGQRGRSFASPPGGLYCSLILQPDMPLDRLPTVTLAVGLACRKTLADLYALAPQIKWPNDLYLDTKKVAGILCEGLVPEQRMASGPIVIAGVGINVNSTVTDFPEEIQGLVTTLYDSLGTRCDLDVLLEELALAIDEAVALLQRAPEELLRQWQIHDYLQGKELLYTSETVVLEGIGLGVSEQGLYRIRDREGREHAVIGGRLRPRNEVPDEKETARA
ncbi:MAG: biotin--[acetyl-CoA-carboxylase] ligase [Desulfobulbus sp.]